MEDANPDKEITCDACNKTIHAIKCAKLTISRSEISCLTAKDRRVKYVCMC